MVWEDQKKGRDTYVEKLVKEQQQQWDESSIVKWKILRREISQNVVKREDRVSKDPF